MAGAIVVVAALVLIPGVAASFAWRPPGGLSIETRVALAFGFGYAIVTSVALLLAVAHALDATSFLVLVGLVSIALWALVARAGLASHGQALAAQVREAPLVVGVELMFLLAVAASRFFLRPERNLSIAAPWRYWADGLEIAAQGRVPQTTDQWGMEIPTTISKVVFNAFEAGISFVLGPDPFNPMGGILAVCGVGLAAALLAVGRELGLRFCALVVPTLTIFVPVWFPSSGGMAHDLGYYLAENAGRLAGFTALLVALLALRSRGLGTAAMAGLLFVVASLSHLIPVMVVAGIGLLYAIATCLLGDVRWRAAMSRIAVCAGVFFALYVGVLAAAGGDLGFQGVRSSASQNPFPVGVDPTASFRQGRLVENTPTVSHFFISPDDVLTRYAEASFGVSADSTSGHWVRWTIWWTFVAIALTGIIAVLARHLIPVAVVAWGLAALFISVALAFSFRYQTAVPADFGLRRLFGYAALPTALIVAGALEAVVQAASKKRPVVTAATAIVLLLLATSFVVGRLARLDNPENVANGLAAIDDIARVIPCNSRVLVNVRTSGTWEATTGRRAVDEGMAPYLRPKIMTDVLPLLLESRAFFRAPRDAAFIERQRVDYVVVVKDPAWIGTAGGQIPRTDAHAVGSVPGLRPVLRDSHISIFAVRGAHSDAPLPRRCDLSS